MVRIINGEIVQDDDPRLRGNTSRRDATSGRAGNIRTMASLRSQQEAPPRGGDTGSRRGATPRGDATSDPLDSLSNALGLSDKFVTIPSIPFLGFTSTRLNVIYLLLLGVMYLLFDYRALLFAVIVYGIYKHQEEGGQ